MNARAARAGRRVRRPAAGAVDAVVGAAARVALGGAMLAAGPGAAAPPAEVSACAVIAAPLAPASFRDGWATGVGLAGGARWPLGPRLRLGIEAEFVQFSPASRGEDGVGGRRRTGGVALPAAFRLGRPGASSFVELVAGIGYGHESIEPLSGDRPVRGARRDGAAWSAGAAIVYGVGGRTSLVGDLRAGGIAGGGTPTRLVSLRLGLRAGAPRR